MEYKTVAEAKDLPGLRLVLTKGMPAPWGESAKNIFHVKGIPYIPVAQMATEPNEDLRAWTGFRNAPVAVLDAERPLDRWLDILMLAERLNPEPALLPAEIDQRVEVIGLCNEICGEWGLGWCRRAELMGGPKPAGADTSVADKVIREYRITPAAYAAAPQRIVDILGALAKRIKAQRAAGSPYIVGKKLTAVDLYWASFAVMFNPLPQDVCPLPDYLRAIYTAIPPVIAAAEDPVLFQHRDYIYKTHLKMPLDI